MYSDNWLTECAEKSGAVIEAPHIVIEHRHPIFTGQPWHPTTAASNAPERYAEGRRILDELRSAAQATNPLPAALTAQPLPPRGMAEPGVNRQRTSAPGAGISHSDPIA
jgi:hypothetical protein